MPNPQDAATFTNRTCVITGAGSGIGRALSLQLAGAGAKLAISDINLAAAEETAELARRAGAGEIQVRQLDVADKAAFFAYADEVVEQFSTVALVINNAGVAVSKNVRDMPLEDFEWLMGINFWGVIYGTYAFLDTLIASGDGHLVNVSSLFGLLSVPSQSAYNAAKFGVRGFTEALRQEMLVAKAPIKVHCVHPGGVKTNIARSSRAPQGVSAEEMARRFEKVAGLTPEQAAAIILKGVRKGSPRILVGNDARALDIMVRVLGPTYQQIVSRSASRLNPS